MTVGRVLAASILLWLTLRWKANSLTSLFFFLPCSKNEPEHPGRDSGESGEGREVSTKFLCT